MKKNIFILGLIGFSIFSCRKKDEPIVEETPHSFAGTVILNLDHKVGADDMSFDSIYVHNGYNYKFTRMNMYLSNFTLGTTVTSVQYALISNETANLNIGSVGEGHYHTLGFNVGLDSNVNHLDPATYDLGNPLGFQSPSQHWNWNSGYIFLVLEGQFDSTGMNDVPNKSFAYHVGMDALLRDTTMILNTELVDGTNNIPLEIDYSKFLTGIDFATETSTHTMDNMMLATKVANNMNTVFKLD